AVAVRRGVEERKSAREMRSPAGAEWAVRPPPRPPVAGVSREVHARVDQPGAQPLAARARVDEQDPQLRGLLVGRDAEDAAHPAAVQLGYPGRLAGRVVPAGIVGDDPRDQRLEIAVPA